ncbi:MAG TPA: hypothetical protein PKW80_13020 [Bacteroidales bacterium]|nr:hypothetical protein [Bacteroidales bacterium]
MEKLIDGLGGAIGSRYLKNHNQLIFVEYGGSISKYNLASSWASTVSQGFTTLKGTWLFDCETGINVPYAQQSIADIWWNQLTTVKRQMMPWGNSRIVNLGKVNFNLITPFLIQTYLYSTAPIIGNNDATNKLVAGDVFCVKTKAGNYCKIKIVTYGYDLQIQWKTYKLNPSYSKIGTGYNQPEDISVLSDENTAYVTERGGNLLRVNLLNANRSAATVVCSGLNTPQQLWVDEAHNQAYIVEYAHPGRLVRIDLATGVKTVLFNGLNLAVGLIITADLASAYISEQGISGISKVNLSSGIKTVVATGLTNPFFLTWADASESSIMVPERDPVNRVSLVDISMTAGNVNVLIPNTAFRPSSVAIIKSGTYCVFCNDEIDEYILAAGVSTGLYMGIGNVPFNLITGDGKADTTGTTPPYLYQFPKDSPFGGTLPVQVNHYRAWDSGARYYRILIDGNARHDTWNDLKLNPANGRYEIPVTIKADTNGFYKILSPADVYYNILLGCSLASTDLPNGKHDFSVEFYYTANAANKIISECKTHKLFIDNNQCVASLDMPILDGSSATPQCGYLKYTDKTHEVTLRYSAYHPMGFGIYTYAIIKGANYLHPPISGKLVPNPLVIDYKESVLSLLGTCPTVAAFSESIYVATTVINGVSRQSQYDASKTIAFCLAP